MKTSVDGLKSRLERTEERTSELQDERQKFPHLRSREKTDWKKKTWAEPQGAVHLEQKSEHPVLRVPGGGERSGPQKGVPGTVDEKSPHAAKDKHLQIQEAE